MFWQNKVLIDFLISHFVIDAIIHININKVLCYAILE